MPSANRPPPSAYDAEPPGARAPGWLAAMYGESRWNACEMWPRCSTPSDAVALNLAQLVARDSHSRLRRRNVSRVVPACISAFASTRPLWQIDERCSIADLARRRMLMSLLHCL
jgi:hypothetical protein